ncbi:MAG TPA: hypothetical protein VH877_02390 [Polyangia bacterium]|jgi:hypothetical protein|nr:hypothetical protein [Polyangia bacterium]
MKRLIGLCLVVVGLVAGGCQADNDQSLAVVEEKIPSLQNGCSVSASSAAISTGVLDVGLVKDQATPFGYLLYPLVRNQLVSPTTGNTTDGRFNLILTGADVELVPDATLAPLLPAERSRFFVTSCGCTVSPGGSAVLNVEVLPRSLALALAPGVTGGSGQPDLPTVIVRLRAVASRAGSRVTSGWVEFPVRLCRYCLTGGTPGACPAGGYSSDQVQEGGCNLIQDAAVTCCTAGGLLCGNSVPMQ